MEGGTGRDGTLTLPDSCCTQLSETEELEDCLRARKDNSTDSLRVG